LRGLARQLLRAWPKPFGVRTIRTATALVLLCLALAGWAATGRGGAAWAAHSDSLALLGLGMAGLVFGRRAGLRGASRPLGRPRGPTAG